MKKKSLLYFLYCVGVILVLIACLIYVKYNLSDDVNNEVSEIEEDSSSDAMSIELNLPNQITLTVGSKAFFVDGYLKVTPKNQEVFSSISTNQDEDGILFENGVVSAIYAGRYTLTFSIYDTGGVEKKDSVLINVIKVPESLDITLKTYKIIVGEYYEISEIFDLINEVNFMRFENFKNISMINNKFVSTSVGKASLTAVFVYDFTEIKYDFNLTIKNVPEFEIEIVNFPNDEIELPFEVGKVFGIQYEIKNRNEEEVNQVVLVEIDDVSVASIYRVSAPMIRIKCLKKGLVHLTITCSADETIKKEIVINFV